MRKKFRTKKCLYSWGLVYDPETGEKLDFKADRVYCKTSEAWVMTYQKSEEDIPKVIRIVFVDELHHNGEQNKTKQINK